jgi:ribosomal protein L31
MPPCLLFSHFLHSALEVPFHICGAAELPFLVGVTAEVHPFHIGVAAEAHPFHIGVAAELHPFHIGVAAEVHFTPGAAKVPCIPGAAEAHFIPGAAEALLVYFIPGAARLVAFTDIMDQLFEMRARLPRQFRDTHGLCSGLHRRKKLWFSRLSKVFHLLSI